MKNARIQLAVNRALARTGTPGWYLNAASATSYSINYVVESDNREGKDKSDAMIVNYKLLVPAYGIPKPTTNDKITLANNYSHDIRDVETTQFQGTNLSYRLTLKGLES